MAGALPFGEDEIARLRAETPGVANRIHLNNCGAGLMPVPVLEAVSAHLVREAEIGGYEAAGEAADAIGDSYWALARMLGCASEEIALCENATRAWDMLFYAVAFAPGERILTGAAEYASNYLAFLQAERRHGAVIEMIPDDADGQIDARALETAITRPGAAPARLISLTHVPTNGGLVNPAAEVGRIAQAHGVPYLLDACQSAGQMPLDVTDLGCDMLTATGRKYLRGPRGTGFLYVRRELAESLEPPFVDLHAATWTGPESYALRPDARRFETWEGFVAGKIGLGRAVRYALDIGLGRIEARVRTLAERLRAGLAALPGVDLRDKGAVKCGLVSFSHRSIPAVEIKQRMSRTGINVSTSGASSTLLDMQARGLDELVRCGVHYYNTEAELDRFLEALERALCETTGRRAP